MTIIIFIIILGTLVLVHEMGHFIAAKKSGVRVEEFGFGYPPRAISLGRRWGTLFSINWIPFGGFVKIFGENYEEEAAASKASGLSFTKVSKKLQVVILAGGVAFNIIFAWILFSFGFVFGLPSPVDNSYGVLPENPILTVIDVLPDSPAALAGLKPGDEIKSLSLQNGEKLENLVPEAIPDFVDKSEGQIILDVKRGKEDLNFEIKPEINLSEERKIIGVRTDMIGILSLPISKAIVEGAKVTAKISYLTVVGISDLLFGLFRGHADVSSVTGPVGIVGLVGDASRLGFAYLLTFTALISINLAVINLVPLPALDGGRILFVIIEAIFRKPINPKFAQTINTVSFALLIALMLFVTYRDILKLF